MDHVVWVLVLVDLVHRHGKEGELHKNRLLNKSIEVLKEDTGIGEEIHFAGYIYLFI